MCTVLLPPGVNLIAVKDYIISYHIISYHIKPASYTEGTEMCQVSWTDNFHTRVTPRLPLFLSVDTNIGLNSCRTDPTVPNSRANKASPEYRRHVHLYSLQFKGCTNSGRLKFVRWHLIRGSNPGRGQICFSSPKRSNRLCGSPSPLYSQYRWYFSPRDKGAGGANFTTHLNLGPRVSEWVELYIYSPYTSGVLKGVWGVQTSPPPKFRRPSNIVLNSTRFVKTVKNCWI